MEQLIQQLESLLLSHQQQIQLNNLQTPTIATTASTNRNSNTTTNEIVSSTTDDLTERFSKEWLTALISLSSIKNVAYQASLLSILTSSCRKLIDPIENRSQTHAFDIIRRAAFKLFLDDCLLLSSIANTFLQPNLRVSSMLLVHTLLEDGADESDQFINQLTFDILQCVVKWSEYDDETETLNVKETYIRQLTNLLNLISLVCSSRPKLIEKLMFTTFSLKSTSSVNTSSNNKISTNLAEFLIPLCVPDLYKMLSVDKQILFYISLVCLGVGTSSDSFRKFIVDSECSSLYYDAICEIQTASESKDTMIASNSSLAVSIACMAAAKLAISDDWTYQSTQLHVLLRCIFSGIAENSARLFTKDKSEWQKYDATTSVETENVIGQKISILESSRVVSLQSAIEALAYLSTVGPAKEVMASLKCGDLMTLGPIHNFEEHRLVLNIVLDLVKCPDNAIREACVNILRQLITSKDDLLRDTTEEIDLLRKVAAQGSSNVEKKEILKAEAYIERAGSAEMAKNMCAMLAKLGICTAFYKSILNTTTKTGNDQVSKMSQSVLASMIKILYGVSFETSVRRVLLADGGLKVIFKLIDQLKSTLKEVNTSISPSPATNFDLFLETAVLTIARLIMITNPTSFTDSQLHESFSLITTILKSSTQPLNIFELLMALTTLASSENYSIVMRFLEQNVWSSVRVHVADDNKLVRRAAVQLWCNLSAFVPIQQYLASVDGDLDIRLLLSLCMEDDELTAQAASGSMAILSEDSIIAKRIANAKLRTNISNDMNHAVINFDGISNNDPTIEFHYENGGKRPVAMTRMGILVLRSLLLNRVTSDDVRARVQVAMENIAKAIENENSSANN
jgi:hypothetical protein